jgi:hypothetical protein
MKEEIVEAGTSEVVREDSHDAWTTAVWTGEQSKD